jgi:hypothetical protein
MKSSYAALLCGSLLAFTAMSAQADELLMRKAGLWEVKVKLTVPGKPEFSNLPESSGQHCVTEASEKKRMEQAKKPDDKCSKQEIKKTKTGYTLEAVCQSKDGGTSTFHGTYTGGLQSDYTFKQVQQVRGGSMGDMDVYATEEHKWISATCPAEVK